MRASPSAAHSEITNLVQTIAGNLMPVCGKEANPQLWVIYDEVQQWALLVEHQLPQTDRDEPVRAAMTIREHLGSLSDKALANEIAYVIARYTPVTAH